MPRRYPAEFRRKVLDLVESGRWSSRWPKLMLALMLVAMVGLVAHKKRRLRDGGISVSATRGPHRRWTLSQRSGAGRSA